MHLFYMVVKQGLSKNMSWAKASVVVGLSGLTPREAERGALTLSQFQKMPDPLEPYGPVVKEEDVSKLFIKYCAVLYFVFVKHVKQRIVYCTLLIFRMKMWHANLRLGSS